MGDSSNPLQKYLNLLYICFVLLVALALVVRVVANDARKRGMSPMIVPLVVFLTFPLGLLGWLLLRPPVLDADALERLEPTPSKPAAVRAEAPRLAKWLTLARVIWPRRSARYKPRRRIFSRTKLPSWSAPARKWGD
jgi:hypothetical protein